MCMQAERDEPGPVGVRDYSHRPCNTGASQHRSNPTDMPPQADVYMRVCEGYTTLVGPNQALVTPT